MRVTFRIATLIVCLFSFPLLGHSQVFDNVCPTGQSSIIPLRTVNITNGHFNDTTCVDTSGNLIFQSLGTSLSASDTFTRANGPLGSAWTVTGGGVTVSGNAVTASLTTNFAFWNDPSFVSTSQFSQVSMSGAPGNGASGPVVFASNSAYSATGGTGYTCSESNVLLAIQRLTVGAAVTLTSSAITGAANDVVRLEITSAGLMTCYLNGVSTLSTTDTTFKSGSPGIWLRNNAAISNIDNWSGGNIPASEGNGPKHLGPELFTDSGTFTGTQMNNYIVVSTNGCSPATQYANSFDYSAFATESLTGCGIVPAGGGAFEYHAVAGYAENQGLSTGVGPIGVYGKCSNTVSVNGRCWGGAFYVSDHNIASNGLYGVEIDGNLNNASTQLHNILITGFWKAQPAASFGIEIAPPQQGVGCVTCAWPTGIRYDTAATLAPDYVNGNSGAEILFPVASGTTQNSQGIVMISSKPISGSAIGGIQLLAAGDLNLVGGAGRGAASTSTASGLAPAGNFFGLTGDAGGALGSGTGKNYGVVGVAKALSDAVGDRAYGGWFKSTASAQASSEVGIHAEVNDAGGVIAEFFQGGTSKATINSSGLLSGQVFNAAGTSQTAWHIVQDTATLAAGTVTVTFTGSAVFTNATSYTCVADDDTAIAATRVLQNSGSSVTITGTGTDVIRYICVGN